jgi:hypothetical protein
MVCWLYIPRALVLLSFPRTFGSTLYKRVTAQSPSAHDVRTPAPPGRGESTTSPPPASLPSSRSRSGSNAASPCSCPSSCDASRPALADTAARVLRVGYTPSRPPKSSNPSPCPRTPPATACSCTSADLASPARAAPCPCSCAQESCRGAAGRWRSGPPASRAAASERSTTSTSAGVARVSASCTLSSTCGAPRAQRLRQRHRGGRGSAAGRLGRRAGDSQLWRARRGVYRGAVCLENRRPRDGVDARAFLLAWHGLGALGGGLALAPLLALHSRGYALLPR